MLRRLICVVAVLVVAGSAMGMAGVSRIASKGSEMSKEIADQYGWPEGALALVNDPLRTDGWNPWFSECPNDINHFLYAAKNTEEINRLIRKLAAVKGAEVRVILSVEKGPSITLLDPAKLKDTTAAFALGSQKILDAWFARLPGGRFGVHTYTEPPKAMTPTLTIYVGHAAVDVTKLDIPGKVILETTKGSEITPHDKAIDDLLIKHQEKQKAAP